MIAKEEEKAGTRPWSGSPPSVRALQTAIDHLHAHLIRGHWDGRAVEGPDSGIRWNYKLGRFIKSYLRFLPWKDRYVFFQTQAYWILSNWLLADQRDEAKHRGLALACAEFVASSQQPQGYWNYPRLRSRIGKIATVEGDCAAIALAETYRRTNDERFLAAAGKWYDFLCEKIGFRDRRGAIAVHYWAYPDGDEGMVPNNATLTLWMQAALADASGDRHYLERCGGMVRFLREVQLPSGELPYQVSFGGGTSRVHFLCFQYNAFQCLDLIHYYRLTGDGDVLPIVEGLARFLATGLSPSGVARYQCGHAGPEVPYYTAALGTALSQATALGAGDYRRQADQAFGRVLSRCHPRRGVDFFSKGNYGLLSDRRPYPRNLTMILCHLAMELRATASRAPNPS